jgi:hypothetical protein
MGVRHRAGGESHHGPRAEVNASLSYCESVRCNLSNGAFKDGDRLATLYEAALVEYYSGNSMDSLLEIEVLAGHVAIPLPMRRNASSSACRPITRQGQEPSDAKSILMRWLINCEGCVFSSSVGNPF